MGCTGIPYHFSVLKWRANFPCQHVEMVVSSNTSQAPQDGGFVLSVCNQSAKKQRSHLEMVGNSNRDSAFSSEKFTDSLQTESISTTYIRMGAAGGRLAEAHTQGHTADSARRTAESTARSRQETAQGTAHGRQHRARRTADCRQQTAHGTRHTAHSTPRRERPAGGEDGERSQERDVGGRAEI